MEWADWGSGKADLSSASMISPWPMFMKPLLAACIFKAARPSG